eukprot:5642830-Pleurochrysis_carterae.AAC.1
MKSKSVMGMNDSSQWFSLCNLNIKQVKCKSKLYRYVIESIPNDTGGKLLVGQLDCLQGNDGQAAYR